LPTAPFQLTQLSSFSKIIYNSSPLVIFLSNSLLSHLLGGLPLSLVKIKAFLFILSPVGSFSSSTFRLSQPWERANLVKSLASFSLIARPLWATNPLPSRTLLVFSS